MNAAPLSLSDIRTARASARQRRDTSAKRLKRIILKLITRIEAYEHELSLLSKVERDVIANGISPELFQLRTETRFDGGVPSKAVLTPPTDDDASSAIRGASRVPVISSPAENTSPVLPVPTPGGPPPANLPAAGEVF